MSTKNNSKSNPLVVVLIFLITAVVVFSTIFLILYLNSDFKEIKAKQTEYYVNVGESVKLKLEFTNVTPADYAIESSDTTIAAYNTSTNEVDAIAGGTVAIIITSKTIKDFVPIALSVTVCDGLTQKTALMIDSKEDLIAINSSEKMLDKYYRLIANIDLAGEEFVPLGIIGDKVFPYTAIFNGDGYSIYNAKITTAYPSAGLFATIGEKGVLTDLFISNFNINTTNKSGEKYLCIGTVAGINQGTIQKTYVSNSTVFNSVADNCEVYVGGVAGFNTGVVAQTGFEKSELVSNGYAGGIVGANVSVNELLATIKQSSVDAVIWGATHIGGVVGIAKGSIISDCYASSTAQVYGINPTSYVGGIAGTVQYANVKNNIVSSLIINCYSVATMGDTGYIGALISWNYNYNTTTLQYNKIYGSYYTEQDTGIENAVYRTQNGEADIVVNKLTTTDLSVKDNFVSYVNDAGDNVMWNFSDIWEINANKYPTLKKFTQFASYNPNNFKEEGGIYSAIDLINMASNLQGNYVLKADIDLSVIDVWFPIGTEATPFEGSLIADTNPSNLEFYKIKNLKNTETLDNAGLFGCVGLNGKISNIHIENAYIERAQKNAAIIAAVNHGVIKNCSVKTSTISLTGGYNNVGLIAAINNGMIKDVVADASLITECEAGEYVIGSIAGINNGVIDSCYTTEQSKIEASTQNDKVLVGGLVGVNADTGHLRFSFSNGQFKGYAVGGLVGINRNNVYECYSQNTLTGKFVGGLAYSVSFGKNNQLGAISNCYTLSELHGVDKHSVKSGFSYVVDYCNKGENEGKYGIIYHCFSAVSFDDVGDNYFETHSRVRTDTAIIMFFGEIDRVAGFVLNSIYDKQGRDAENITSGIFNNLFDPTSQDPAIGLDSAECFVEENFTKQGFSNNIWAFSDNYYPQLINVVKAN